MPEDNDIDYYRARAAKAAEMAERASEPGIRRIHETMARNYSARAGENEIKALTGVANG